MAIAITAAAAAVDPSPPPPTWRTGAWLACAHLAGTTMVCLLIASLWLFLWGCATSEILRFACGPGSSVVAKVFKVVCVARVTFMVVLAFLSFNEVALKRVRAAAAAVVLVAAAATDVEATKPALKTSDWATRMRGMRRDPIVLGILASLAFMLVMVIALLVMAMGDVMGFRRMIVCSVIYYVGALGMNSIDCFVLCPLITVRIWRTWRKARRAL